MANMSKGPILPEGIKPKYISPKQARVLLHCGHTTIYKLIADGTLRSIKLGRSRKIDLDSAMAVGSDEAA